MMQSRVGRIGALAVAMLITVAGSLCAGAEDTTPSVVPTPQSKTLVKPKLVKLPFSIPDAMENTPIVFNGRPMLVENRRPGGWEAKGENATLRIVDLTTGQEVARFGKGHSFVTAFVDGPVLNVFATEFTDFGKVVNMKDINRFSSTDLKTWKQEPAIAKVPGTNYFNSSVCRDDQGYVMAYECDKPVQFCVKFARSRDLSTWETLPDVVFAGLDGKTYSACPVIRFVKPYYYVIYAHLASSDPLRVDSYMIRSKDLESWELSPLNPVLEACDGEGINNSDVDLLEWEGNTYLFYATGDQNTWGSLRAAMYAGPMKELLEAYFPAGVPAVKIDALRREKK
jgi:hypothetical protein